MSHRNLDLHTLECFDLVMRERSVSRAAEHLGISQSSASEMLARLRERFADPLLIRTRDGMRPTPRAEALLPHIRTALQQLRQLLEMDGPFNPKKAVDRFRLTTSDYTQLLLMPELIRRLQRDAPACAVDVLPINVLRIATALESGDIDLAIAYRPDPPIGLRRSPLLTDTYVCLARREHREAAMASTPELFANLAHINVAPSGLTYFSSVVDTALASHGLKRRIVMSSPHFLLAAHVVCQTNLVLALPLRAAQALAKMFSLTFTEIPLAIQGTEISMYWHDRCHVSPRQKWFRSLIRDVLVPNRNGERSTKI